MPNRLIKETIRTSKSINTLSDFQFRLWVYLITYVDDYGRGSADPEILKGFVFPRRKRVTEVDIKKSLAELAGMGCINLYSVDGESYFCFPNWGDHQRIQTKRSKYPEPSIKCESRKPTVNDGEKPIESNPIQYELESELESESESEVRARDATHGFDAFWNAYPKKKAKQDAQRAWDKLKPDEALADTIIASVLRFAATKDWTKDGGQFVPYPATFLNGRRWEDETQSRYSNLERLHREMEALDEQD